MTPRGMTIRPDWRKRLFFRILFLIPWCLIVIGVGLWTYGWISERRATTALLWEAADMACVGGVGLAEDVQKLPDNGANPKATRGKNGWTILMRYTAESNPNPHVLKVLLAAGADVNARDRHGDTALVHAGAQGNVRMVELLEEAAQTNEHPRRPR